MKATISGGSLLPGALVLYPESELEATLLNHWVNWPKTKKSKFNLVINGPTLGDGKIQSFSINWSDPRLAQLLKDDPKPKSK